MAGGPDLGGGTAAEKRDRLAQSHDRFRHLVVNEPRGFEAVVGGLWMPADGFLDHGVHGGGSIGQVVFFNNVAYLGMCVHGTMGLGASLRHAGIIADGRYQLETPAGTVTMDLGRDGSIAVENVESFRIQEKLVVETDTHGRIQGDVAWGGNWFFLVDINDLKLSVDWVPQLTAFAADIRRSLLRAGIQGGDGHEIDHIELFGPPTRADADSKNFVMCPGGAYDRSPCGTGTSAKLACLAADGKLQAGEVWRQESIIGSRFEGTIQMTARGVIPTIRGRAFITAESRLQIDPKDTWAGGVFD